MFHPVVSILCFKYISLFDMDLYCIFLGIKRRFSDESLQEISKECTNFILSKLEETTKAKDLEISRLGYEVEFLKVNIECLNSSIKELTTQNDVMRKRICLQDCTIAELQSKQESDYQKLQNSFQNYITHSKILQILPIINSLFQFGKACFQHEQRKYNVSGNYCHSIFCVLSK